MMLRRSRCSNRSQCVLMYRHHTLLSTGSSHRPRSTCSHSHTRLCCMLLTSWPAASHCNGTWRPQHLSAGSCTAETGNGYHCHKTCCSRQTLCNQAETCHTVRGCMTQLQAEPRQHQHKKTATRRYQSHRSIARFECGYQARMSHCMRRTSLSHTQTLARSHTLQQSMAWVTLACLLLHSSVLPRPRWQLCLCSSQCE